MVKTLQFKTNINCEECVKNVSPLLDGVPNIYKWNIDLSKVEKILTVTGENIHGSTVKAVVRKSGYQIRDVHSWFSGIFSSFRKSYQKDCCH